MKTKNNILNISIYKPGILKKGAIKMASNENALGSSPLAKKAIKEAINSINIYPDNFATKLKTKLAKKYNLSIENFIIGNGSDEIILFLAGAFLDKNSNMITSEFTFSEYTFAAKVFDSQIKYATLKSNGKFDLNKIIELIDKNTSLIFICNPNNPTGNYVSNDEINRFLDQIPSNIIVVIDEAYFEYATNNDFPDSVQLLKKFKNIIVLRTFSKIYGLAGLRIGYGIASKEIIEYVSRLKEPFNVNSLALVAAEVALDDTNFINNSIKNNEEGKVYLQKKLEELNIDYFTTQTNFIMFKIEKNAFGIFNKLMNLGVTIRPFQFNNTNFIRVTIGTPEENEFFIKNLKIALDK